MDVADSGNQTRRRLWAVGVLVAVAAGGTVLWIQSHSISRKSPGDLAAAAAIAGGASPTPELPKSLQTLDAFELRRQCNTMVDRALELKKDGKDDQAVAILEMLCGDAFPPGVRVEANRLLGQMEMFGGDRAKAERYFSLILDLVHNHEMDGEPSVSSAANALNLLFVLRLGDRSFEGALEANSAILDFGRERISADTWANTNTHQAMVLDKLGRPADSLKYAQAARQMYKELDLPVPYWQTLVFESSLREQIGDSGGAIANLSEAWQFAQTHEDDHVSLSTAAMSLHNALVKTSSEEAMTFARDAYNTLSAQPTRRRSADRDVAAVETSLLSSLTGAYNLGRPDLSLWAFDRLESRAGGDQALLDSLRIMRADMDRALRAASLPKK